MSPEQRFRLEQAKNNTPSTGAFIWVIPAFLFAVWLCQAQVIEVQQYHVAAVGSIAYGQ